MAAVRFAASDGVGLSGILHGPSGAAVGVAVCHPHPHWGGSMATTLVRRIAEALGEAGCLALRFDFRGVGESEGRSTADRAEIADALGALDVLAAPGRVLAVVGYSYGAWVAAHAATAREVARVALVAPPISAPARELPEFPGAALIVCGDDDAHCPEAQARDWAARTGARPVVLDGADHFLAGAVERVAEIVVAHVCGCIRERPAPSS